MADTALGTWVFVGDGGQFVVTAQDLGEAESFLRAEGMDPSQYAWTAYEGRVVRVVAGTVCFNMNDPKEYPCDG